LLTLPLLTLPLLTLSLLTLSLLTLALSLLTLSLLTLPLPLLTLALLTLSLSLLTLSLLFLSLLSLSLLTLSLLTLSLLALALLSWLPLTLSLLTLSLLALALLSWLPLTLSLLSWLTFLSLPRFPWFARLTGLSSPSLGWLTGLSGAWLTFGRGLASRDLSGFRSGLLAGRRGAGELAVDLVGEVVEFPLGSLERGGLVAEDPAGSSFDPFAELAEPFAGGSRGTRGLVRHADLGELLGLLEGVGDRACVGFLDGVEQLPGQQRLGLLGLLDGLLHPVEEAVELGLLVREPLLDFLTAAVVAERGAGSLLPGVELFRELVLPLVELAGLVAHGGEVFVEPVG
jgi:hypothetical protein